LIPVVLASHKRRRFDRLNANRAISRRIQPLLAADTGAVTQMSVTQEDSDRTPNPPNQNGWKDIDEFYARGQSSRESSPERPDVYLNSQSRSNIRENTFNPQHNFNQDDSSSAASSGGSDHTESLLHSNLFPHADFGINDSLAEAPSQPDQFSRRSISQSQQYEGSWWEDIPDVPGNDQPDEPSQRGPLLRRSTRLSQGSDTTLTPSSDRAPSIREGASTRFRGSHSQHSVTSRSSRYNPDYQLQRTAQRGTTGDGMHSPNRERSPEMEQEHRNEDVALVDPPAIPLPDEPIRTCYCDNIVVPPSCTNCTWPSGIPCIDHEIMTCDTETCDKTFHRGCAARSQAISTMDCDWYQCMECQCDPDVDEVTDADMTLKEKASCVGVKLQGDGTTLRDHRKAFGIVDGLAKSLKQNTSSEIYETLLNTPPRPYPSPAPLSEASLKKHAIQSRRVETSLLLYSVCQCDSCGRVQPEHKDDKFTLTAKQGLDPEPVFERKALMNKMHKAWHCECEGYCRGSQHWPAERRAFMDFYRFAP